MADKDETGAAAGGDEKETREYVPSARDRMIEDLATKSEAFRAQQAADFNAGQGVTTDAATDATEDPNAATTGATAATAATATAATTTTDDATSLDTSTQVQRQADAPRKVKVKVEGQELEVDEADLVASYQKGEAATRRLQEATRLRDEAQRIRDEAARGTTTTTATPTAPAAKTLTPEERKQKLTEYHEALYNGDSEKAAKLFDEVMATGRGDAAIPDVNTIVERVTPAVRAAISNESALENFHRDFKDVVEDPISVSIAQGKLNALVAEGKPLAEALTQAGNETRAWIASKSTIPSAGNGPTTRSEKLAQKGEIVTLPTANARAAPQPGEKPQSNTEYVAEMKRRRGQA